MKPNYMPVVQVKIFIKETPKLIGFAIPREGYTVGKLREDIKKYLSGFAFKIILQDLELDGASDDTIISFEK